MKTEHDRSGVNLFLPWILANTVGLALGLGLFAFFTDAVGGEHGTVRSDMGYAAGFPLAGAVIGFAQWLALRRKVGKTSGTSIPLLPTFTLIVVVVLGNVLLGSLIGPVMSTDPMNPAETIKLMIRFFGILSLGVLAAVLVGWQARGRQLDLAGWGVLASSAAYPVGFVIGIAALGPPIDFLVGVAMVGLVGGIFQSLAMRSQMIHSGWWVAANALGSGIGTAVALLGAFVFAETIFPVSFLETALGYVVILSLVGTIAGAIGGAISGAVLVRLVRQPSLEVSRASAPS